MAPVRARSSSSPYARLRAQAPLQYQWEVTASAPKGVARFQRGLVRGLQYYQTVVRPRLVARHRRRCVPTVRLPQGWDAAAGGAPAAGRWATQWARRVGAADAAVGRADRTLLTTYALPTRVRKWTVLRSPHVNKKARHQYEWRRVKRTLRAFVRTPDAAAFLAVWSRRVLKTQLPYGTAVRLKVLRAQAVPCRPATPAA